MKKKSCRRTDEEREQHERAIRIRKMTDAQICEHLDSLAAGQHPAGPVPAEIIDSFLDALSVRTDDGLRVSDATIRKLREIARKHGFIPPLPPIGSDDL